MSSFKSPHGPIIACLVLNLWHVISVELIFIYLSFVPSDTLFILLVHSGALFWHSS